MQHYSCRSLVRLKNRKMNPFYLPTFLFRTSSPCRWLIWRNEPLELMALTGLTTLTGLLDGLERPLTSSAVPFPNRLPLFMLLLLMENDLYRLSSNGDLPAVCRSVWDLALSDISKPDRCSFAKTPLHGNCDDAVRSRRRSRFVFRMLAYDVNEVLRFTSRSLGGSCHQLSIIHYL